MKYVKTLTPPIAYERNSFPNMNNKQLMLPDAGCVKLNLLQLVFSACVVAEKCQSVGQPHHCAVSFGATILLLQ